MIDIKEEESSSGGDEISFKCQSDIVIGQHLET
jgi:hypothetical protein